MIERSGAGGPRCSMAMGSVAGVLVLCCAGGLKQLDAGSVPPSGSESASVIVPDASGLPTCLEDDAFLGDETVTAEASYRAASSITAGTGFVLEGAAQATLWAGSRVVLAGGFSVRSGASMTVSIVPGLCQPTGALLATHALLGTPTDDAKLEEMYTQVTRSNIYRGRGVFNILSGADSLRDTKPLQELIAKYITAKTLERVAGAYRDSRLLVLGTTNVDYGQTWVWKMLLVAKDGNLELYRKVLLAYASFPIVFPPLEIDGHLFVDGAARSNVVVAGMGGTTRPKPPLHGEGNLYLINNGRLNHPPEALRRALGNVAATTVSVMMDQSMQTALTRSYFGAQFLGYAFKMVAIPDSVEIGKDPLAVDPNRCAQPSMPGERWRNRTTRGRALRSTSVTFPRGHWMR